MGKYLVLRTPGREPFQKNGPHPSGKRDHETDPLQEATPLVIDVLCLFTPPVIFLFQKTKCACIFFYQRDSSV